MNLQKIFDRMSIALRNHKLTLSDVRVERHSETGPTILNPPSHRGGMHGMDDPHRVPCIDEARVEPELKTFPVQTEILACHSRTQANSEDTVKTAEREISRTGWDGSQGWRSQADGYFE
jgi:hypothetical protein